MNSERAVSGSVFDMISGLGAGFLRLSAAALGKIIGKPLLFLLTGLSALLRLALKRLIMLFAPASEKPEDFAKRAAAALRRDFAAVRRRPLSFPFVLAQRIRRALFSKKPTVGAAALWLLPLFSFIAMLLCFNYYSGACMALKIECGTETLGYVASESEYLAARESARELLSLADGTELPELRYSLALIDINGYTPQDRLCESIIKHTDEQLVSACSVYIDGEFLCAVENENQARGVFGELLAAADSGEGFSAFIQQVQYREGLFPESSQSLWSIEKLKNRISQLMTVQIFKTEVSNEPIDFETLEIETDSLYSGSKRVLLEGEKGAAQVTSLAAYVNGEKISSSEVSRITVKEPVARRVQIGTKPVDEAYSVTLGGILVWPVANNAFNINSDYGMRWGKLHAGLDIGSAVGTSLGKPVVAAAGGTVVLAGVHSSYGWYVIIDHGNGMQTLYAHCMANSFMVTVGQTVVAGQPIARVGQTGFATGPHLHFEVRINGSRVNPRPYLGI